MKFINLFRNELRKEFLTTLSYKSQWLGEFSSLIIFYWFLRHLGNNYEHSLLSYGIWFYSILILGGISGKNSSGKKFGCFLYVFFFYFFFFHFFLQYYA